MDPWWTEWKDSGTPNVLVRFGCVGPTAFSGNGNQWFTEIANRSDENLRIDYGTYIIGYTSATLRGNMVLISPGAIHRRSSVQAVGCSNPQPLRIETTYRFEPIPGSRRYSQMPRANSPTPRPRIQSGGDAAADRIAAERQIALERRKRELAEQQRRTIAARQAEERRQAAAAQQRQLAEDRAARERAVAQAARERQAAQALLEQEQRERTAAVQREARARQMRDLLALQQQNQIEAVRQSQRMVADFNAADNDELEAERRRIQADLTGDAEAIRRAYTAGSGEDDPETAASQMTSAAERLRERAEATSRDGDRTRKVATSFGSVLRGFGRAITGDASASTDYQAFARTALEMAKVHEGRRERLEEVANELDEAAARLRKK
ncbi:MAG TPA: hypothetical protein VHM24_14220 [Gemmatimonadaceae bacterium]|nr:hypothetical protein [Gemmatimonadaceae bacterium]